MNSQSLRSKAKNLSIKSKISVNTIIRFYMYERFLERLSLSNYKDNFIIKGVFYLSTLFGLENRSTMDIDVAVRSVDFTESKMVKIINEILKINLNDNVVIVLDKIEKIREENEYSGYRFTLVCKLDNIREKFRFDVATWDPITPSEIRYNYSTLFGERTVSLWAYNIETVLAEKIETIMTRNILGSRMKDYYDIYLIISLMLDKINISHLKRALYETFKKRGSLNCFSHPNVNLDNIKEDEMMNVKWKAYQRKNAYAKNISLDDIINKTEELLYVCSVTTLQPA